MVSFKTFCQFDENLLLFWCHFFSCLFTISDRNDIASSGTGDDLDVAMGTLMAYGGKYLREMALWAWEYGTQTPVESLGKPVQATQTLAEVASVT